MSRHKFEPTPELRKMVLAMAGYGIPHDDIALTVMNPETDNPITAKTLRARFRRELDTGHIVANAKVAENLFKMATGSGPKAATSAIWWSKARMGWKESSVHELTGKDGGQIDHRHGIDFSDLTREERDAFRPILQRRIERSREGAGGV